MATITDPTVSRNPVAYHASFDGQHGQHGQALRDALGACWFITDEGTVVLLHNEDAAYLLLHGRVDVAHEQRLLDDLAGGLLQLVDARNSHRPLAA